MMTYTLHTLTQFMTHTLLYTFFNFIFISIQAKKAKQAEIERKRAEVRKRMEEASKAKKAKKGFMTPERKKKLRVSTNRMAILCAWMLFQCGNLFVIISVVAS